MDQINSKSFRPNMLRIHPREKKLPPRRINKIKLYLTNEKDYKMLVCELRLKLSTTFLAISLSAETFH